MIEFIFALNNVIEKFNNNKQISYYKEIYKNFLVANDISFVKKLPEFQSDYMVINNENILCGQIIKRPLKIPLFKNISNHFGVVLGTSVENKPVIIEMTNSHNIRLVDLDAFLADYSVSEISIEKPQPLLERGEIIERAKEIRYEIYSLVNLNCSDFAYYCAGKIPIPKRMKKLKEIMTIINQFELHYRKLQLEEPKNERFKVFLKNKIKELENLN